MDNHHPETVLETQTYLHPIRAGVTRCPDGPGGPVKPDGAIRLIQKIPREQKQVPPLGFQPDPYVHQCIPRLFEGVGALI